MKVLATDYRRPKSAFFKDIPNFWANWADRLIGGTLQSRTGPEQGFPCVLILTGKNLFSLQGTPLLIAGILYSLQGIPCEN